MPTGSREATWSNCRADFAFDGVLIDLIVPGTGPAEWEQFWSALCAGPFALHAFRNGESIPLPDTAAWALAETREAAVMVSVVAGPVTVNCHFFGGDLELDIDPREVADDATFAVVLDLMRLIAAAVRLPALAVPQSGSAEHAFLRVTPDGQAAFLPALR